jgi:hypothetical protein
MPSGPTEPVTRSQDQVKRRSGRAASDTPGPAARAISALLLFITVVQYPV